MNDLPGNFLMFGLHKLAAERGEGLVPELLALFAARAQPAASSSSPSDSPARELVEAVAEMSAKPAGNDNVIALRPCLLARKKP
ncbi:MAG: hypothetical protein JWM58_3909 [Rhizobium sp.]|nr:hypothetical protein [Rhizobium sp.]